MFYGVSVHIPNQVLVSSRISSHVQNCPRLPLRVHTLLYISTSDKVVFLCYQPLFSSVSKHISPCGIPLFVSVVLLWTTTLFEQILYWWDDCGRDRDDGACRMRKDRIGWDENSNELTLIDHPSCSTIITCGTDVLCHTQPLHTDVAHTHAQQWSKTASSSKPGSKAVN